MQSLVEFGRIQSFCHAKRKRSKDLLHNIVLPVVNNVVSCTGKYSLFTICVDVGKLE